MPDEIVSEPGDEWIVVRRVVASWWESERDEEERVEYRKGEMRKCEKSYADKESDISSTDGEDTEETRESEEVEDAPADSLFGDDSIREEGNHEGEEAENERALKSLANYISHRLTFTR